MIGRIKGHTRSLDYSSCKACSEKNDRFHHIYICQYRDGACLGIKVLPSKLPGGACRATYEGVELG